VIFHLASKSQQQYFRPGEPAKAHLERALYNRPSLPAASNVIAAFEALLLLWACRIALWVAPFPRVLRFAQFCAGHLRSSRRLPSNRVVRSVVRALPFTWGCSCLTQALAGWIMLTRHGAGGRVSIGVASPDEGSFAAHAWLECEDCVILGDIGLEPYNVIWSLTSE
jgi:hypothetical protein